MGGDVERLGGGPKSPTGIAVNFTFEGFRSLALQATGVKPPPELKAGIALFPVTVHYVSTARP